jgi:hypothetical protein
MGMRRACRIVSTFSRLFATVSSSFCFVFLYFSVIASVNIFSLPCPQGHRASEEDTTEIPSRVVIVSDPMLSTSTHDRSRGGSALSFSPPDEVELPGPFLHPTGVAFVAGTRQVHPWTAVLFYMNSQPCVFAYSRKGVNRSRLCASWCLIVCMRMQLVVTDTYSNRLVTFLPDPLVMGAYKCECSVGDDAGFSLGQMNWPWGVVCSPEGQVFVSENQGHRVQEFR